MSASGRILVIGGGASGTLLAAHLLGLPGSRLRVTLVERRHEIGRGVAYSTDDSDHILNTRAASMSAFPADPEHFWRWLVENGYASDPNRSCADPFCFVPRQLYGRYLEGLLAPYRTGTGDGRLDIVTGECVGLGVSESGVAAQMADGSDLIGHAAVLATGHDMPGLEPGSLHGDAWGSPEHNGIAPDDTVLIVGTGLTMVDAVIRLLNAGHRGRIVALSRHGKLPQPHARNRPLPFDPADIPFGTEISYLSRWFRRTVAWAVSEGRDWRDVIDGIRPHTAALWTSLTPTAKRRFLRHARTFWDIHRHRMPAESRERILAAQASGQLDILAGRLLSATATPAGGEATIRNRSDGAILVLPVRRILACTGTLRPDLPFRTPLLAALEAGGTIRRDPLGLSLDVDDDSAVLGAAGTPSPRVFALGPLTAAKFWEVMAVPDIRVQCAGLAARIERLLDRPAPALAAQADASRA